MDYTNQGTNGDRKLMHAYKEECSDSCVRNALGHTV